MRSILAVILQSITAIISVSLCAGVWHFVPIFYQLFVHIKQHINL